jgi:hypothetical protein
MFRVLPSDTDSSRVVGIADDRVSGQIELPIGVGPVRGSCKPSCECDRHPALIGCCGGVAAERCRLQRASRWAHCGERRHRLAIDEGVRVGPMRPVVHAQASNTVRPWA